MIVADASFLIDVLLRRPNAVLALAEETVGAEHEPIHAPELIEVETLHVLRQLTLRGELDERQAGDAVRALARARLLCFPHAPFRQRIWELRHNLTAYDASYVTLAEVLDESTLLTGDSALGGAARKLLGRDSVRVVA